MKHINIVIIDGVERDMATLSAEEREKIVNELNRVAVPSMIVSVLQREDNGGRR